MIAGIRLPFTTVSMLVTACLVAFASDDAAAQARPFLDPQFDFTVDTFQYGTGDVQVGGVDLGLPFPQKLLFLDLYKPVAMPGGPAISAPAPAIILIHGGGFITGTRDNPFFVQLGETFARLGYVYASIGYRKVPDDPPGPGATPIARAVFASIQDGFAALQWMRDNATTHGLDPDRIGVGGHSAGSIISQFLGFFDSTTVAQPQAVLSLSGTIDSVFDDIDAGDPPILLVYGTFDVVTPFERGLAMARRVRDAGVPVEIRLLPEKDHVTPVNSHFPGNTIGPLVLIDKYINFFYESMNIVDFALPAESYAGGFYVAECAGAITTFELNGSLSSGPAIGLGPLSYLWSTTQPGAVFDDPTSPTPTLTVDTSSIACGVEFDVMLAVTDDGTFDTVISRARVIVDDSTPPTLSFDGFALSVGGQLELPTAIAADACDPSPVTTMETIVGFEGLADGLVLTTEINGMTLGGATVSTDPTVTAGETIHADTMPFTTNVLQPDAGGVITITFETTVSAISFQGWSAGTQSVIVETFAASSLPIASHVLGPFARMIRFELSDTNVRTMVIRPTLPADFFLDNLAFTYDMIPVGQTSVTYTPEDACEAEGETRTVSVFIDDFADGAFSESSWTQPDDPRWTATAPGTWTGNGAGSAAPIFSGANGLGCATVGGFNLYRNTVMTMGFDMTYTTNVVGTGAGGVLLADVTHPDVLPVVFFDLIVLSIPQPSGPAIDTPFLLLGQFNNFGGAVPPGTTEPIILDLQSLFPATFSVFDTHHIEATLLDNIVTVTMDGSVTVSGEIQPLLVPGAPRLQQGAAGLFVGGGNVVTFDNFTLSGEEICLENTPVGFDPVVEIIEGGTVTFDKVTAAGSTTVTRSLAPPMGTPLPSAFQLLGEFLDVSTTAVFEGLVEVCLTYDEASAPLDETTIRLMHFDTATMTWLDVTSSIDTDLNIVCGITSTLSPFAVAGRSLDATFLAPLGDSTTAEDPAGPYKRGRTIPIKLRLVNGQGLTVSDAEALAFEVRLKVSVEQASLTEAEPIDVGDNPASSGDAFRYDADNDLFIFNLSTKNSLWMANFTYSAQVLVDGLTAGEVFFALR